MAKTPIGWAFGPVPLAVMQDSRLTMSDKAVYAAVAVVAHGMPYCDASQPGLAQLASTSRNTVAKALSNLEEAGWLTILTAKGRLTRITVSYPNGTGSLTEHPSDIGRRGGVPLESITSPMVAQGSSVAMQGCSVLDSPSTTIEKKRNREEREPVAIAPSEDEDLLDPYPSLQIERIIEGKPIYDVDDDDPRRDPFGVLAKPTVSPIPQSEQELPYEATHNGRSRIVAAPIPEGHDQFGDPIDPNAPKAVPTQAEPVKPWASGTF